jgi:hypothetical protein
VKGACDEMGSSGVAAWIAHLAFWALIARGRLSGELGVRPTFVALALWLAAYTCLPLVPYGAALFSSVVAVIDIVLVLLIFKGDVRIM